MKKIITKFLNIFSFKNYSEKDLVDFGNFLLSESRNTSIRKNKNKVHQEDLENFKSK